MSLGATTRAAVLGAVLSGMSVGAATAGPREVDELRPSRVSRQGEKAAAAEGERRRHGSQASTARRGADERVPATGALQKHSKGDLRSLPPLAAAAIPLAGAPTKAPAGKKAVSSSKTPAPGAARGHGRDARAMRERADKIPCVQEPVAIERGFGGDVQRIALTRCDGRPAPLAIEQLSVLVRPMNAPRPITLTTLTTPTTQARRGGHEREWVPGVKLIHEGLVTRLQSVVNHFKAKKVTIVSGYRPTSVGSFHQSARAMDFHVDGVTNEALVAYCRSLADTGCGYYPNSSFVHMDVRAARAGHVYWIDASGPGEVARYVAAWPLRDTPARSEIARPDAAAPADEHTHEGAITRLGYHADAIVNGRATPPVDTQEDPFTP